MISLPVTRTLRIRGSLLATVLMPSLHDLRVVYCDQPSDATELSGVEAMVAGQAKWLIMGSGPGTTVIAMTLSKPVQANQIGGEMVYNDPATGAPVRMPIAP